MVCYDAWANAYVCYAVLYALNMPMLMFGYAVIIQETSFSQNGLMGLKKIIK